MSLTSEEVNFLIYRYLQESGFHHSAFTFGSESLVHRSTINGQDVPPGSLVSFIQKGIQYLEIEANLTKELPAEMTYYRPLDLLSVGRSGASGSSMPGRDSATGMERAADEFSPSDVTLLQGHESEVFMCSWNPVTSRLASGSGDGTARIWEVPEGPVSGVDVPSVRLPHLTGTSPAGEKSSKDVTTIDWSANGDMLATGSYDGKARIWTCRGLLQYTLDAHRGPIFSLKWNRSGSYLLSGSVDKSAIVWNAANGHPVQTFSFHSSPVLDVDWRTDSCFASCSTDRTVCVCQVGMEQPIRRFEGHSDEVNCVKWDPRGRLLASCSDDCSARIWSMDGPSPSGCVHVLEEHNREIYSVKWSPTGPGTANPNKNLLLATASFDATVRLWDVERGVCLQRLTKHTDPVYSVAFSPNGEFLVSGSFDTCLHVWSVKDGTVVKTFRGNGGVFEVCWNHSGDKIAACFASSHIAVIDFRMM
eukprot:TRINITY_DN2338_c0_g1_i1.p1 TRINITY_DN2338_c0_g1~~TRINITY_DN2338_c0_g1_i1.p1  ORF type:complete len:475 (+),score=88.49 TRINITY_DN2338_c0_g1_i1:225-1649(+)